MNANISIIYILICVLAISCALSLVGDAQLKQGALQKQIEESPVNFSKPLPYREWTGKKVLYVYAHIDDMEASSGGLNAEISKIVDVHLLILTNGDKGCGNQVLCGNSTNAALAAIRQTEQWNSALVLGIPKENIVFLAYEDCLLSTYPSQDVLQEIVAHIIRSIQPDVAITWDPQSYLQMTPSAGWDDMGYHPDHQKRGQLTLDSIWLAQLDRAWPHLGEAWRVSELYFWAFTPTRIPDYYFEVNEVLYDKKVKSFLAMHSQYTDENDVVTFLDFIGSQLAAHVGLSEGSKA